VNWSLKGKTVLFTGASRGMGRFAAIELARLGAEILVAGHNRARGDAAVEAIRGTGGWARFLSADMGDAAQVSALAAAVLARSGPVHVLIHSAGGMPPTAARTREGVDRGFAQNFLGAFLLTRLLQERLLASAGDRGRVRGAQAAEKRRSRRAHAPRQGRPTDGQLTERPPPDAQLPDRQARGDQKPLICAFLSEHRQPTARVHSRQAAWPLSSVSLSAISPAHGNARRPA